ncbi:MAG: isochorismatase family cysteine hydrolase [Anaerolineae bacterium]|nr:cysteine hydrolase [Thermoflexales bacterium]MDW8408350.1 isochorismatase family cysteine hydrolase [Anaerolineae bacterium]
MSNSLAQRSAEFVEYVEQWLSSRPVLALRDVVSNPERVAIVCVDVINGFCTLGPLASPRVQGIVAPITELFKAAHQLGVRHFILPQDTHAPDAVEFRQYPPHCVRGTPESETAPELQALPFSDSFVIVEKNSLSSAMSGKLDTWLTQHPEVDTFVVTGDCSDLCTYQLAMHLRLRANEFQMGNVRVILPANCVQTYHTPVTVARQLGIPAHDGDLLHAIFLFNMAVNGVEVVARLE